MPPSKHPPPLILTNQFHELPCHVERPGELMKNWHLNPIATYLSNSDSGGQSTTLQLLP